MKFEIVVIPVSDVDRAKEFYGRLGWRLDAEFGSGDDFRIMQFTPPGSGCSIIFGKNVTAAAPGSAQGLYLIVSDIAAARDELRGRGVEVSEVFHSDGVYAGTDEPYLFGRRRISGPDPERGSYRSFASFRDPDGNGWLFQEVTTRLPGRIDSAVTTLRVRERPGGRVSACRGRPRQVRGPARPGEGCELAGVVRRVHGRGAGGHGAAVVTAYDAIIIGTGQAGPSLAARLAGAGMKVAIVERKLLRRHLRQHRLHSDQDDGGERLCGPHGARAPPSIGVDRSAAVRVDMKRVKARKDAISGQVARRASRAGCRSMENCTVYQGHARFESRARGQRRARSACTADAIFINVGGRAVVPDMPGLDEIDVPHQQLDDGGRFSAAASDRRGRQLHRPRVRPDVPALRQRGDDHRNGRRG